jgi:uncharacterized membrane protein SirB2
MRYALYYPIHFTGIFLLFMSLGAICLHCMNGGTKENNPSRKFLAALHGVGLLLTIVGGMGLMKAVGAASGGMPAWIILKMFLWLILGSASMIVYKQPGKARLFFFLFCAMGILAALTAKFKSLDFFLLWFKG